MEKLESYLNDHLAGSVGALELIEHSAHQYDGEPLGVFFSDLQTDIRADQDILRDLMRGLTIDESNVRKAGAWAAEKAGRARLMIAGDEPGGSGLVLALEGLIMGVTGKKFMWRGLAALNLPPLSGYDFKDLERRAEQQIERIEIERIRAAQQAFVGTVASQ
jgi:hypothetical protein